MSTQTTDLGKVAITPAGEHSASNSYDILDLVTDASGSSYLAKKDVPEGVLLNNTEYWQLIAAHGAQGAAGEQGPAGEPGEAGPQGPAGADGEDGDDGKSAYQIAVEGGYTGTEAQFADLLAHIQREILVNGIVQGDGSGNLSAAQVMNGSSVPIVTSLNAQCTNEQIPGAKATWDAIQQGGGGSSGEWVLLNEVTLTEDAYRLTITQDSNGNSFRITEAYIETTLQGDPEGTSSNNLYSVESNSGSGDGLCAISQTVRYPTTDTVGIGLVYVKVLGTVGILADVCDASTNNHYNKTLSRRLQGDHSFGIYCKNGYIHKIGIRGYNAGHPLKAGTSIKVWGYKI